MGWFLRMKYQTVDNVQQFSISEISKYRLLLNKQSRSSIDLIVQLLNEINYNTVSLSRYKNRIDTKTHPINTPSAIKKHNLSTVLEKNKHSSTNSIKSGANEQICYYSIGNNSTFKWYSKIYTKTHRNKNTSRTIK